MFRDDLTILNLYSGSTEFRLKRNGLAGFLNTGICTVEFSSNNKNVVSFHPRRTKKNIIIQRAQKICPN